MANFEHVAAAFWDPDSDYGRQAPLTPELVAEAERELGVKLPEDLLRLLRIQNGGGVAAPWTACPVEAGDYVPFGSLSGIGPSGGGITLLDTPYLVREWDIPSPVVLLDGDGHTWVALDYRISGPQGAPAVTWFDVELAQEVRLAPDFRAFVERLQAEEDFALDD